jgi:hypothetical protein
MAGIFVSHAGADKPLVDHFVDDVIRLGCGAQSNEIFYSSGEDTGVPSGDDLMAHVRQQVTNTSLVVAVISPNFQTRPVCIAELGAAWSRAGSLFPLLVPEMPRNALAGVLPSMLIRYINDSSALDELHDRLSEVVGFTTSAATWGRFREKWLASVDIYAAEIVTARVPTLRELEVAESNLQSARQALGDAQGEIAELHEQIEKLAKAKTAEGVRQIRLPKSELRRFEALRDDAHIALAALPGIVQNALWFSIQRQGMPWPKDYSGTDEVRKSIEDGFLVLTFDDRLEPNGEFGKVQRADTAVREVARFLDNVSVNFSDWFRAKYDMPPKLDNKAVWNALFARGAWEH